ncbi:uncharacterized protein TA04035 [Theileria annulata]|uniref:GPI transamidase subunit PIG-U n=1 Tax=Theileria annulata TaxID=5874 RepID=Q4UC96_THEAN|nr:uncharacterized protein TA04035 [Theileria annulata]CAI75555.1 hypothetical protein, conserved [Theileria annulata]|eukprot:XP_955031.1 hypothetical protein, conserved [Theileria annulata]
MSKRNKFIYYSLLIVLIRITFILILYLLKVFIPFMISKNAFDIHEYIELFRCSNYKSYMKSRPFYYFIIKRLTFMYPDLSVKFLMTVFIFVFDFFASLLLYRIVKYISYSYKKEEEDNEKVFGTASVKHSKSLPIVIFTIYLLNPPSVFYNYSTNPDGYKYFLLTLSIYSSLFSTQSKYKRKSSHGTTNWLSCIKNFRFSNYLSDLIFVSFILKTSHSFLPLLFPIVYIRKYHRVKLSSGPIKMREFLSILREFAFSTTFVLIFLSIFKFKFMPELENPYRALDSHPSIDFSISWYLNELLPVEFIKGTMFKNHFIGFVFTIPLLVGLRKYPFDYLLIMTCICILTQPEMTVLGVTFILIILTVNYKLLQRTQPFSKLVHTILALLIISVFSYSSWIGRYMANPNYFFGPQIIILILICKLKKILKISGIILDDYTKMVYFRHTGGFSNYS